MASSWAKSLPVVYVPMCSTPKRVTFIYPYYECPVFLDEQVRGWCEYDATLRSMVSAIVVDDGSPTSARLPESLPFPVRLFRIEQDVRWNWLAARNIGANHADDGWLLLTDMDHVVPEVTLHSIIYGTHDHGFVYAFSRREYTGEVIQPHSASFLMTREMFWKIGGYDETFSGLYGSDGEYRRRVASVAPIQVLGEYLVRYEYVSDASTTRYARKQPEDAMVQQIVAARGADWKPKTLSFDYHEVGAC